ncbi:hypothetical protein NKI36_06445 [Mesorhizobium caraganae]|uniref:Uncharacterized protein n=1 Tax=Mesorhizobium caraganae TaxID=483206 RepID=A0ABV1YVH9_9HYPH
MQFAQLVIGDEKRAELHRAERILRIHDRIVQRFNHIDHLADLVEKAAADLVEASVEAANERTEMAEPHGWTIGL